MMWPWTQVIISHFKFDSNPILGVYNIYFFDGNQYINLSYNEENEIRVDEYSKKTERRWVMDVGW